MKNAGHGKGERGQILIWTTLMIVTLFCFVALAIDVGFFYQYKRRMQAAADSAAVGGAHEVKGDSSITQAQLEAAARNDAALNGFTHGSNGVDVAVFRPPTSGTYTGQNGYVEAIITHSHPTFFARIFNIVSSSNNFNTATVRARAVAGAASTNCIYVLDPDDEKAFEISSGSRVEAGCGVQVNSNKYNALSVTSNSYLVADPVDVVGGVQNESPSGTITPDPNPGATAEADPMAGLQPPLVGSCAHTNFELNSQGTPSNPVQMTAGVYCGGIKLKSGSHATLSPGIYILKGGGLSVESLSSIIGTGVTFYNTQADGFPGAAIQLLSNSTAKLSAPTTGDMKGILFFQDPTMDPTGSNSSLDPLIASNISSFFTGVIYFPNHMLKIESNTTVNSGAAWTQIIVDRLKVSSGTDLRLNVDNPPSSPAAQVKLAE